MRGRPGSEPDHEQPNQFAALLNHLFATRLTPEGRPYTLTEVSKGTGLSVPYLSILRKGTIGSVPFQRVAALARFFGVSLDYFSQEGPPTESLDEQVRLALAQPLGRDLLLRAGKIGTAQRALVLQMIEHAERVLQELPTRTRRAAPGPPGGGAGHASRPRDAATGKRVSAASRGRGRSVLESKPHGRDWPCDPQRLHARSGRRHAMTHLTRR